MVIGLSGVRLGMNISDYEIGRLWSGMIPGIGGQEVPLKLAYGP